MSDLPNRIKKLLLRVMSFFVSLLPSGSIESVYRTITKFKPFKILINTCVTFFIPEKIKIGNLSLFLNQKDAVVSGSLAMGVYESFESQVFLEKLKDDMVVVDIGANIGYYTLLAAEKAKQVISFEPDPVSFTYLQKNVEKNNLKNVEIHQLAIAQKAGTLDFYKNPHNFGDSRVYSFKEGKRAYTIKTISLDEFIDINNIGKVDVIKIDIQGAEGLALLGMQNTLAQQQPELFIEFFPKGLVSCGTNPKDFINALHGFGYSIWNIDDHSQTLDEVKDLDIFVSRFKDAEYRNLYCKKLK